MASIALIFSFINGKQQEIMALNYSKKRLDQYKSKYFFNRIVSIQNFPAKKVNNDATKTFFSFI